MQGEQDERRNEIKDVFGVVPEVIFVLSGGIKEVKQSELKYRSTSYSDQDDFGVTGGRARVIAAAEIAAAFPEVNIVTTSRSIHSKTQSEPTHATVIGK